MAPRAAQRHHLLRGADPLDRVEPSATARDPPSRRRSARGPAFHALIRDVESLRVEVLRLAHGRDRLNEAASACASGWTSLTPPPPRPRCTHFEDNGISVGLVFRLRQLRERIVRVRLLLDCLLSPEARPLAAARLMSSLVQVGRSGAVCARCSPPAPRWSPPRWPSAALETGEHTSPARQPNTAPWAQGSGRRAGDCFHHADQVCLCTPWRCRPSGRVSGRV